MTPQELEKELQRLKSKVSDLYQSVEPALNLKTGGDPYLATHYSKAMQHIESASAALIRSWLPPRS